MDERRNTGKGRKRFVAALAVYLAWVAALGTLAALSGYRPASRPSATESR
jgi:hypothetical protein